MLPEPVESMGEGEDVSIPKGISRYLWYPGKVHSLPARVQEGTWV